MNIPITQSERDQIEHHLNEFVKLVNCCPDNIKAYVFMEFVKRNNSEMRRLKNKYP